MDNIEHRQVRDTPVPHARQPFPGNHTDVNLRSYHGSEILTFLRLK